MPRVLRIHNRLIIGGPAINVTYLSKYMEPEFETTLVIGGKDDHEQGADYLIENLELQPVVVEEMKRKIFPLQDGIAYRKIKELIEIHKPDIVHTHAAKSGIIGRLAADACKVPVVVHTFHGHVFHSYFNSFTTNIFINIERYLAARSTGIVAISESQKRELAEVYKICDPDKIKIISLGLDLDKFQINQEHKRQTFRSQYQIQDDELAIGIIGRVVSVKNHELFVAAAKNLLAKTTQKLRFIIIGDGDRRKHIETLFAEAGIAYSYVPEGYKNTTAFCTSWQTEIDKVLAGLDIVALTSHNEGTPVSLIEAQAASKPIVSTRVGGVADIMVDEKAGYITPPNDVPAFTDALLQLVENKNLREAMSQFGKTYVQEKFSYQRLVKEMSAYYYQLLQQKGVKHSNLVTYP
ncbi:MAG TPA: glycosyltransferase [Flavipsychrobacter sp.]|nr:glycosyltransferase [Flavipsychrobacter sp.]